MKRFITVAKQHAGEILLLLRNGVITAAGAEAYSQIIKHLRNKKVAHNDQQASHQNQLPHQGGYVSFYLAPDGRWMQVEH